MIRPILSIVAALAGLMLSAASFAACTIMKIAELPIRDVRNRPLVEGQINGQSVRMLVDTGSFSTFISEAEARRLGLKLESVDGLRVFGLGGERRVAATRIKKLQFGAFTREDVLLPVICPQKSSSGRWPDFVIGEDILEKFTTEFDLANGMIRLLRADGCQPEQLVYWSKSYSMADLERSSLDRDRIATTDRAGAIESNADQSPVRREIGSNGRSIPVTVGLFDTFSIGDDETVRNVELRIADLFGMDTEQKPVHASRNKSRDCRRCWLDATSLLSHRVLVASKEHKLFLTYNGGKIFQVIAPNPRPPDAPASQGEAAAPASGDRP
jgi:clan AA aspartic protease (TIGR02281 family)